MPDPPKIQIKLKPVEWRQIEESQYWVSELGQVRDAENRILTPSHNQDGYLTLSLAGVTTDLVHRMVAIAFLPNPWNLPVVDHINNIRDDARLVNLHWVTWAENAENRTKKPGCTSKYFGVCKVGSKWVAQLYEEREHVTVGKFKTEMEAVQAYDYYVKSHYLTNKVNFP